MKYIPGSSANIDHLVTGPAGVWVLDSKAWHRRTVITGKGGALRIGSRSAAAALKGLDFERGAVAAAVERATHGRVSVGALVVVHGTRLPRWAVLAVNGVPLVRARQARSRIRSGSPALGGGELAQLLDRAFPRYIED